jgi:hypothetical protein
MCFIEKNGKDFYQTERPFMWKVVGGKDYTNNGFDKSISGIFNRLTAETNYWITKGREIENHLSDNIISKWLREKHNYSITFQGNKNIKLENNITDLNKKIKLKYNSNKTLYSSEISTYIDFESISILDLEEKLKLLITKIRDWNA